MKHIVYFIKKETVLSIAIVLGVLSAFWVHPNQTYLGYIDVRTLAILFSLMVIVAGLKQIGVFDWFAEKLLRIVSGVPAVVCVLVLLCFFSAMFITNDVALITFVPFTIVIIHKMPEMLGKKWMIQIVVMQTIAANLGSMLTPIGNPQNLYLFGQTSMGMGDFIVLMFPYTITALIMLLAWIVIASIKDGKLTIDKKKINGLDAEELSACKEVPEGKDISAGTRVLQETSCDFRTNRYKITGYGILFLISLLVVMRLFSYGILFVMVLGYTLLCDRKILARIDYSLLATFVALFVFIGNLGRIPLFHGFLERIITGHEVATSVIASQVMSNVPTAILLSGFTQDIRALMVGTNIGGLGTLIASMASLISFKYIAKEDGFLRRSYFILFTVANVLFLIVMLAIYTICV